MHYRLKEVFPKPCKNKWLPSVPCGRSLPGAGAAACGSVVSPRRVQELQQHKPGPASRAMLLVELCGLNSRARIFVVPFFLNQVDCFLMKKLLNSTNRTQHGQERR